MEYDFQEDFPVFSLENVMEVFSVPVAVIEDGILKTCNKKFEQQVQPLLTTHFDFRNLFKNEGEISLKEFKKYWCPKSYYFKNNIILCKFEQVCSQSRGICDNG
jgi:hypothetical protein